MKHFNPKHAAGLLALVLSAGAFLLPKPVYADAKNYTYSTKSGTNWTKTGDNEWSKDVNGDGKTDVVLHSEVGDDGNLTWTYTFYTEDDKQTYNVYETMKGQSGTSSGDGSVTGGLPDGYQSEGSDGKLAIGVEPGVIDGTKGDNSYTITNKQDHEKVDVGTGSLKLTKTVTGTPKDPDQVFNFTVTLSVSGTDAKAKIAKDRISGAKVFGTVPFVDGVGTVSLKAGGAVTMTDIPEGVSYDIKEETADGYTTTATGNTGTIVKGQTSSSVFTNASTYNPPKRGHADWTLTKKVTGAGAPDDGKYSFYVLLENLEPNTVYAYTIGTKTTDFTSSDTGSADISLELAKDESAVFKAIPVDATYQVSEAAGDYISSYTVNSDSSVAKADDENTEKNKELATSKETVDEDENATVTFTNNYPATQSLTLKKVVADKNWTLEDGLPKNSGSSDLYRFTVEFFGMDQGASITGPGIADEKTQASSNASEIEKTADEFGEIVWDVSIPAGADGVTFKNIPAGTQYKITEPKVSGMKASYMISTADMNGKDLGDAATVLSKNASGEAGKDLATGLDSENETVEDNQSDTVTFINQKAGWNFGIIKKGGAKDTILSGAEFELYKYENGKLNLVGTSHVTDKNGFAGWTTLDDSVYVLKETKAPDGYSVTPDIVFRKVDDVTKWGETTETDSIADAKHLGNDSWLNTVLFLNRTDTWTPSDSAYTSDGDTYEVYTISDAAVPQLPNTGGIGLYILLIGAGAVVILGVVLGKKRNK